MDRELVLALAGRGGEEEQAEAEVTEAEAELRGGEGDAQGLALAGVSAQQLDLAAWDGEGVGQQFDQRRVGGAVDRRRGELDLEATGVRTDDAAPGGPRDHLDVELAGVVAGCAHEGVGLGRVGLAHASPFNHRRRLLASIAAAPTTVSPRSSSACR